MLTEKSIPYADELKFRVELIKAFCDTAKSYVQISAAALALPLVFTQMILGKTATEQGLLSLGVPWTLKISWIAFLVHDRTRPRVSVACDSPRME